MEIVNRNTKKKNNQTTVHVLCGRDPLPKGLGVSTVLSPGAPHPLHKDCSLYKVNEKTISNPAGQSTSRLGHKNEIMAKSMTQSHKRVYQIEDPVL